MDLLGAIAVVVVVAVVISIFTGPSHEGGID
jgi:hypothetical protein